MVGKEEAGRGYFELDTEYKVRVGAGKKTQDEAAVAFLTTDTFINITAAGMLHTMYLVYL